MIGRKQYYEVRMYKTEADFIAFRPTSIVGEMDALSASWFGINETKNNAVVKIQSDDREEIWIIKARD